MKFKINKYQLQQLILPLSRLNTHKSVLNIFKSVQINFDGYTISAVASDDEMSIKNTITTENYYENQTLLIDLKMLLDIVKILSNEDITFEIKGNILHIKQKKLNYKIALHDNTEFPTFDFAMNNPTSFNLSIFNNAVEKVQHCISKDSARLTLNGVYCDFENRTVVATDSFRISATTLENYTLNNIIITPSLINELKRIEEEYVDVEVRNKQLLVRTNNVTIIAKTIEGTYPNYQQLLSKKDQFTSKFKINVAEFRLALEHVSLFKTDGITITKMYVTDNQATIETKTQEVGESKETLEVSFNGEPIEATFNAHFILQSLKQVDNEELELYVLNNVIAFGDDTTIHLIMQMKIH